MEKFISAFLRVNATAILSFVLFGMNYFDAYSQIQTTDAAPNWNNSLSWNPLGVPSSHASLNVKHSLIIDKDIIVEGGNYEIRAELTDEGDGDAYQLSISKRGNDSGFFDLYANATLEGKLEVKQEGKLIIRSGNTLEVGIPGSSGIEYASFANNSRVIIEAGGVLIVNGNLKNENNSSSIEIHGKLIVKGTFEGRQNSVVFGDGEIEAYSFSGNGNVFGNSPLNCNGSSTNPCNSNNLCSEIVNTISGDQSICVGQIPSALDGENAGENITYQWQFSNNQIGWGILTNATLEDYTFTSTINTETYYRRIASNGNCANRSNVVKISMLPNGVWLGKTTSWSTTSNWCGGTPGATTNVLIQSGVPNMPAININSTDNYAYANNLTIAAGASLTFTATSILRVKSDFNNYGTFNHNELGTVEFNGDATQTIRGTTTFHNLTITNKVTIAEGASNLQTVRGTLILNNDLITNDNLIQNLSTGLIKSVGSGNLIGDLTVKRDDISGAMYHYISSPVSMGANNPTVSQLNDNVRINTSPLYNLYKYNETILQNNEHTSWFPMTNLNEQLEATKGYILYFWNTATVDLKGTYDHKKEFLNIPLNYTSTNDPTADGWNLLGNPYPSPISWDSTGWNRQGVDNSFYCWNGIEKKYSVYAPLGGAYDGPQVNTSSTNGATPFIPAMQSFFVKSSSANSTSKLSMPKSIQVDVIPSSMKNYWRQEEVNTPMVMKLTVSVNGLSEETIIRFVDGATSDFDPEFDAYALGTGGNTPDLYTVMKNKNTIHHDINSLPYDFDFIEVPLYLKTAIPGKYTISALEALPLNGVSVHLLDKSANKVVDLKKNPDYTFDISIPGVKEYFVLRFTRETITEVRNSNEANISISQNNGTIGIDFNYLPNKTANIEVYDVLGKVIAKVENADISSGKYLMDLSNSNNNIMVIRIVTGEKVFSSKVLLRY